MQYRKSGVWLSPGVFEHLYTMIIEKFEQKNDISSDTLMDYQLFGYGNYDATKPNLKQFLIEETNSSVNGKYLYNKYLDWTKGKSPIKLNREFTHIYFNAIGHKDLSDFLKNSGLSESNIKEQNALIRFSKLKVVDEYYLGFNQNNEGEITKSKLVISNKSQTVTWTLSYVTNEILTEYSYPGEIKHQENGMSFFFENKKNELDRSLLIAFYFDRRIKKLPYLIGSFASYDRDRKPVMGIVLFERMNDLIELDEAYNNNEIDHRIANFITGKRWSTQITLPLTLDDLPPHIFSDNSLISTASQQSLDKASIYLHGTFNVFFQDNLNQSSSFNLEIDKKGIVKLENESFKYEGHAFISEGSILSIQITQCNQVPHSSQILAFIGRYSKDKIKWIKGSWHGLDERLSPCTKEVIMINEDHNISNKELLGIQESKETLSVVN